ncbi:hypothetical protein NFJ02_23g51770 [Pycnococcus provasolii]
MAATPMASDVSSTQPKGLGLLSPSAGTYLALQGEGQTDTLTESLIVQGAGAFLALPAPPGALVERVGRVSRLLASCGTTTLSPVDEGNIFANLHERIDWEYLSSLQIDTEYTVDDLLVVSTDVGKFIEDGGRALENFAVLAENDEKYASKYTETKAPQLVLASGVVATVTRAVTSLLAVCLGTRRPHAKLEVCIASMVARPWTGITSRLAWAAEASCRGVVSVQLEKLGLVTLGLRKCSSVTLRSGTRRGYANWVRLVSAYRLQESESRLMAALHEYRFHRSKRIRRKGASSCGNSRRNQLEFKGKLARPRRSAAGELLSAPNGRLAAPEAPPLP